MSNDAFQCTGIRALFCAQSIKFLIKSPTMILKNAFYYSRLIRHVCSGPIVVMRLEYKSWDPAAPSTSKDFPEIAIRSWRELMGPSKLFANIYKAQCVELDQLRPRNFRQLFAYSDTRNFGMT